MVLIIRWRSQSQNKLSKIVLRSRLSTYNNSPPSPSSSPEENPDYASGRIASFLELLKPTNQSNFITTKVERVRVPWFALQVAE